MAYALSCHGEYVCIDTEPIGRYCDCPHSIPLLAPHHLLEAEKFNIRYTDPAQITCMADKLRWYRYKKALLQREVPPHLHAPYPAGGGEGHAG